MKPDFYTTLFIICSTLLMYSCKDSLSDNCLMNGEGLFLDLKTDNNSLILKNTESSRSTENGTNEECIIGGIDLFFINENGNIVKHIQKTSLTGETTKIPLYSDDSWRTELADATSVYAIANTHTLSTDLDNLHSLSELQSIFDTDENILLSENMNYDATASYNKVYSGKRILMDGTNTWKPSDVAEGSVGTINIELSRAASKIELQLSFQNITPKGDKFIQMGNYQPKTSVISSGQIVSDGQINVSELGRYAMKFDGNSVITYSYPISWKVDENKLPYLLLNIPTEEKENNYYKVPINASSNELQRNMMYVLQLDINQLGGTVDDPIVMSGINMSISDWNTTNMEVEGDVSKYLSVDKDQVLFVEKGDNKNPFAEYRFYSSSPLTEVKLKDEDKSLSWKPDWYYNPSYLNGLALKKGDYPDENNREGYYNIEWDKNTRNGTIKITRNSPLTDNFIHKADVILKNQDGLQCEISLTIHPQNIIVGVNDFCLGTCERFTNMTFEHFMMGEDHYDREAEPLPYNSYKWPWAEHYAQSFGRFSNAGHKSQKTHRLIRKQVGSGDSYILIPDLPDIGIDASYYPEDTRADGAALVLLISDPGAFKHLNPDIKIGIPPRDNEGYALDDAEVSNMVSPALMISSLLGTPNHELADRKWGNKIGTGWLGRDFGLETKPNIQWGNARFHCKDYLETIDNNWGSHMPGYRRYSKTFDDWRLPTKAEIQLIENYISRYAKDNDRNKHQIVNLFDHQKYPVTQRNTIYTLNEANLPINTKYYKYTSIRCVRDMTAEDLEKLYWAKKIY